MAAQVQHLSLSQQQRLQQKLSPQQVQFVRMLEMNRAELEEAVKVELDDNPALEAVNHDNIDLNFSGQTDDDGNDFHESADDILRADYSDPDDIPSYRITANNTSPDEEPLQPVLASETSIVDFLWEQLGERNLSDSQKIIADYVVGNIDSNGYLQRSPAAIADDIAFQTGLLPSVSDVIDVIDIVHSLDPPGIGAANLRECLLLQLQRRSDVNTSENVTLAVKILNKHFEEFYKKHYDRMPTLLGVGKQQAADAIALIRSLNPKPGNVISDGVSSYLSQQIIPDFNVDIEGNSLKLSLLNSIPELQIEHTFSEMYSSYSLSNAKLNRQQAEAASFVKQKYDDAANFIRILRQTTSTLYDVAASILNRQKQFFLTGDEMTLRPMVLKDIADDLSIDISVVSRATAGKYINTPWGVFPLKFFFNEGLAHSRGEEASSREIQSILKQIISDENKRQPLSDEQLCNALRRHGYDIARRTIAKYRKILNIPVARLRREV